MKNNRKLCLSLKRRVNAKLPGYVPGKFKLLTKVPDTRDKSQASLTVFTLAISITAHTNHIIRLGCFLLFSGFLFHLTYSVLPSADSARLFG